MYMDAKIHDKMSMLDTLAFQDDFYKQMLEKMRIMERKINELEHILTCDQRNLIWDFWGLSTEMDRRKLELACQYMDFKEPD